jgi:hypothetical protein
VSKFYDQHESGRAAGADSPLLNATRSSPLQRTVMATGALIARLGAGDAYAYRFDTGIPDLTVDWDNTFQYTLLDRVKSQAAELISLPNVDDGDRNFKKGIVSNRVDLFSELDVGYKNYGFRVSAEAWYDAMYHGTNDNNSPATANASSVPYNQFTSATTTLMGQDIRLMDAFVYGHTNIGNDTSVSFRAGRHALIWGETLFYGANGIAGAMAPIDYIKLQAVPGTPFKEVILPTNQVSGEVQLNSTFTVGGFYKLEWERDQTPAAGSYFSPIDILDTGGERILAGPPGSPLYFGRIGDLNAKNSGQGGIELRIHPQNHPVDYGLYLAQFHATDPVVYVDPTGHYPNLGNYQLVFPENIRTAGASASTTVGDVNFGAEVSVRWNMPLVPTGGSVTVPPNADANNSGNPAYPVGRTAHANLNWIWSVPRTPLFNSAEFLGEIAWNRRMSIEENAAALDPNSTRDATAMRLVFTPTYTQVMSGVDLNVPIGLSYGINGRSSVFNPGFSVYHGGDMSFGVTAIYQQRWKLALNYVHYYGALAPIVNQANQYTYGQYLKDRDFVSLTFSGTF